MSRDRWPAQMSVQTAAEYLDVAPRKIEDLIKDGELVAMQEGDKSKRFILRSDLDAYVEKKAKDAREKERLSEPAPAA